MVTSISSSTTPVIPGIAGLGNLPANAAYQSIIKKGEAKQLAAVAAAPQVAKEEAYFKAAIGRMDSVDDLLKDRRALTYLLTSYGLGSEVNKAGIIKKVLTEDPSQKRAVVNSLADSRWRTLAVDLDTYNSGLGKLKGDITKDTFSASTIGNRYLQVFQQDALGTITNSFYSNNFNLSVLASGKLATSEGYTLAGYKLDNRGKVQQIDPNSASNSVTVISKKVDDKGINVSVGLSQSLKKISGDQWQWTVKDGNNTMVSQQVEIKFAADGRILTIDGSINFNKTATLDWGTAGTSQQSFDLKQIFDDTRTSALKPIQVNWFDGKKTATSTIMPSLQLNMNQPVADPNFFSNTVTQTIKNPDKASNTTLVDNPSAQQVGVKNTLTRVSGDTWQWTVKSGDQTLLSKNVDITFNADGTIATVDGDPATEFTETLDWGGAGTSSATIDLADVFSESKETVSAVLQQSLTRVSGDTWQWKITKGGQTLLDQNVDLTFKADGTLQTINGEYATSKKGTLNLGSYIGGTEQTFELGDVFKRGDFTQVIRVVDNIGVERNVRIDYNRVASGENRWQAKVWFEDGGTLAATIDFKFDANGKIASVGTYDSGTNTIRGANNQTNANTFDFKIDWQRTQGSSEITLDFSKIFSQTTLNLEVEKPKTDSIALGKRKGVDIDENGNVSVTYAKADGTGDIKMNLYRLAANTFDFPNSLRKDDKTGYFTAPDSVGFREYRPLGSDKDLLGRLIDGFAGKLDKPAKTTNSKSVLDIIASGYNQNIFEQALGKENMALRYAVYFKNNASKMESIYHVMGDRAMRDVVSTVFNIPERVATQPVETQAGVFGRKLDVAKLKDPKFVDQFIQRFLALSGSGNSGGGATGYQAGLLSGGDSGTLLNMVAQNINILT